MQLIPMKELTRRLGVSRPWVYQRLADASAHFPRPVRLSEKRIAFVAREVDEWAAARLAERDTQGRR
jgi:prophage regulatory protein